MSTEATGAGEGEAGSRRGALGLWERVAQAGAAHVPGPGLKRLRIVNQLAVLMALSTLPNVFVLHALGAALLGNLIIAIVACYVAIPLLNRAGHLRLGRMTPILVFNVAVFLYSAALGPASNVHLLFFVTLCLPFILFEPQELRFVLPGTLLPVALWLALDQGLGRWLPATPLSPGALRAIATSMVPTTFLLLFASVYLLYTENLRNERRLGTTIARLADEIEQRRRAEAELVEARNVAVAASEAKASFLATMSHEIRTPMNGVIGAATILQDTALDEDQRDLLRTIRLSGEALLGTINDILDFSKIEAGKLEVEHLPLAPAALLEDTLDSLAFTAQNKGLELASDIASEVPPGIDGDPLRLRQVLINLVGNAIKFTARGEVIVQLGCAAGAGEGAPPLRFEVHDSGSGVPEEARERLFHPFTQADSSTTRKHGGTGLGLAISRSLVEAMGGTIGVGSSPLGGSCFWFTLPGAPPAPPTLALELGRKRVLVVAHSAALRQVLERALGRLALQTVPADEAAAVGPLLARAQEAGAPIDLVLIGQAPAGAAGLALGQALAAGPGAGPPVLLLLPAGQRSAAQQATGGGSRLRTLAKPVRRDRLRGVLQALAGAPPRPRSAPPRATGAGAYRGAVLIAEDNQINQKIVRRMLEQLGVRCDLAPDGAEAVAAAARGRYELILMDLQMPVLDGLEATVEIRRQEGERGAGRTAIVALTANALTVDQRRCTAAGMDGYLTKPIRPALLEEVIARYCTREGGAGSPPP